MPAQYASKIPSIAFSVPDLDGMVKLELKGSDGQDVGCIESAVGNGHTFKMPVVTYAAAGIAAAALALSMVSAVASGGTAGASTPSPTFGEVIGWFQGVATNGMLSVQYPLVYQSFTTNFGFSTGLIPWGSMQNTIDSFRQRTGGNLTDDNYPFLLHNATLLYDDGTTNSSLSKRALDTVLLWTRDGTEVNVNGTSATFGGNGSTNNTANTGNKNQHFVKGIEAYVEQLAIPQANTFMTVLLIFAIIVAAIIVGILLIKVILELCSIFGSLPKSLESWRKRYWWRMAKALTNLVFILYGTWTLYCIYQFTDGDSWAAKVLAGVTLGLFTVILAGFTWKIWATAHHFKKLEGDAAKLYEDKEVWIRYSLFYDNYKRGYWWVFVPAIVYMFARGCVIAGGNGHGMVQAAGQMFVEGLMLIFLVWARPYQRRSGQWINITIQSVRLASVACILVFVEEFGISQTTKTITGVILIVVQSVLTALLAILIAINALIVLIKENPHRRNRKEAENFNRDIDNLTPLDARNSLLLDSMVQKEPGVGIVKAPTLLPSPFIDSRGRYDTVPRRDDSPAPSYYSRPSHFDYDDDNTHLITGAAGMPTRHERNASFSPETRREPRLPDTNFGRAM